MHDFRLILLLLLLGCVDGVSAADLTTGHIIGIVFGAVVFLKIVVILTVTCCARCKRQAAERERAAAIAATAAAQTDMHSMTTNHTGVPDTQPNMGYNLPPGHAPQQYFSHHTGPPGFSCSPGQTYPEAFPAGYPGYPPQTNINLGYAIDPQEITRPPPPDGPPGYLSDEHSPPPSYEETLRKDQEQVIYPPTVDKDDSTDDGISSTNTTEPQQRLDNSAYQMQDLGTPLNPGMDLSSSSANQMTHNAAYQNHGMEYPTNQRSNVTPHDIDN